MSAHNFYFNVWKLFFSLLAFREVFDLFDSNGGGTIDAEELDLALQSVDVKLSQDEISEVLSAMDKDGKLSLYLEPSFRKNQQIKTFKPRSSYFKKLSGSKIENFSLDSLNGFNLRDKFMSKGKLY